MNRCILGAGLMLAVVECRPRRRPPGADPEADVRVVDLDLGEQVQVTFADGKTATVKLLDLEETATKSEALSAKPG